jgi:hypothetical protein
VGNRVKGADAVIESNAGSASGVVTTVSIIDSGIGYEPGERVLLTKEGVAFAVTGSAIVKTQGKKEGYWRSTRGFLDADKYIQDSKYYQEYSYEIQAAVDFSLYKDVVRDILHIAGTELFGRFTLNGKVDENGNALVRADVEYIESSISQT